MTQQLGIDLDWKSLQVLKVLDTNNGEATTSLVKTQTGIEDTSIIRYRFKKLANHDLITTTQPTPDNGGPIPPKIANLTDKGRTYIDTHPLEKNPDTQPATDQIEQLTARLNELDTRLETIENALTDDTDTPVDIDALKKGFIGIETYLREEANANLRQYHPDEQNP